MKNLIFIPLKIAIYLISIQPFFVLHFYSKLLAQFLRNVIRYRRHTILENLNRCFPEWSFERKNAVLNQAYLNFTDLIFESIKTFTLSKDELHRRMQYQTPAFAQEVNEKGWALAGLSSHLANWEWLPAAYPEFFNHHFFAVYKPLSQKVLDRWIKGSRERFGTEMISMKSIRSKLQAHSGSYCLGLLGDQAPHDYHRAIWVRFFNEWTPFFPGLGIITTQYRLKPVWGWVKRKGRSRYEWGVEPLRFDETESLDEFELKEIKRIQKEHQLSHEDAESAYRITRAYACVLEESIRQRPEDWLWTHRRFKKRRGRSDPDLPQSSLIEFES